ncbi:PhzF family phenazine biosynthesis protein [Paractinoplanes atraurantiacus]|uniref:PhzF family phenazine biosynthesis protein n=1 Tax=Paractinoplanes atraurantiacus TaxID=1036182 RepID=UPI000BE46AA2|nr:PhzF family phenazine biosynthesis protein [Actinoplanes atraurantiacus]
MSLFAPADGIPEDPVTGGAHTALTPYWPARLGRADLSGRAVTVVGGSLLSKAHDAAGAS